MPPRASVVVCTHNRSVSLAHALENVLRCEVEGDGFEVIVVDNASSDSTPALVAELIDRDPDGRLRYVREDRLGLHHARHAGARAAEAPLLLYTDDDVEVSQAWVQAYVEAFAAHPEMAAAGGPVRPRFEASPPRWLLQHLEGAEACGQLAVMDRGDGFLLGADGYFFGVNMAIRRTTLGEFGGFRPESFGAHYVGSGEWGLVEKLQRAGVPIGYVPRATVWHRIPAARVEPAYFERWAWIGTSAEMFERWYRKPRTASAVAADLRRIVRSYWRIWLRAGATKRAPDLASVHLRSEASAGRCELVWLWWMLTRRDLRAFLDTEHFGP